MTENYLTGTFADAVSLSFDVPEIRPEFVAGLYADLMQRAEAQAHSRRAGLHLRPAWIVTLAILALLILGTLVIGPQRVYAEFAKLLGYIPGVGLVDENSPIRVLAEPVSVTRDGVTMSVTSAFLTTEKSIINYGASGVPLSAYPIGEAGKGGCIETDYFLLPDGTKLDVANVMGPLPANLNRVTLVIPCIFNTLPGTVPTDWELPLRFIPAPPDFTMIPVTEIPPTPTSIRQTSTPVQAENPLTITKVLKIGDQYVLMGEFRYGALGKKIAHDNVFTDDSWAVVNEVDIVDAAGQVIPTVPTDDIQLPAPTRPDAETWKMGIDKLFIPPLTIRYDVEFIRPVGAKEQAEFTFDAGPNPQDGDKWMTNQDFKLGGYNLHLLSIYYSSNFGFEFYFKADPGTSANAISVDLPGYTSNCGGGGGGDYFPEEFTEDFCITPNVGPDKFPKGKLTAVLSFQALSREHKTYQIQWSPDSDQAGPYATATPQPGVCLSRTNFAQLQAFPTGMTGKVLLNERQDNDLPSNLILVNLDGSQPQALLRQGYGGVLSPDGKQLAYATVNGITLLDIATGQSVLLKGTPQAYGPWSPDGKQIAYVGEGGATTDGIFVVPTDGSSAPRRLTNLGYEAIAGWSPDGQRLYYAIPGLILKEVDMSTGVSRDLFALKDSSAKDPSPTLSPDGVWIAYAGTDGLYVVRTDGTQGHLLIDDRSLEDGISGLSGYAWGQSSDWLVVNLVGSDETDNKVILLNPDTCEAYLLPNLNGEVKGLILP